MCMMLLQTHVLKTALFCFPRKTWWPFSQLAGQKSVPVSSFVRERVKCQALSEVMKMYVVDMPHHLHVVLGQSWLKSRKAVISYADKRVMFWQGDRRSVLKCFCDDTPVYRRHLHCHLTDFHADPRSSSGKGH